MIIPNHDDIEKAVCKLEPSEKRQLDDAVDNLQRRLRKKRGNRVAGIGHESLLMVCVKAGAVMEQRIHGFSTESLIEEGGSEH